MCHLFATLSRENKLTTFQPIGWQSRWKPYEVDK